MKKSISLFAFCFIAGFSLSAQESNPANIQTPHYLIAVEPGAQYAAESLAKELEQRFAVFNTLFRFDPKALAKPLKARVFVDEASYNSYTTARSGISRRGALYLHYDAEDKRELVVLRSGRDDAFMLPHQSFVQFFRGFIANPPAWMLEGLAIYFSTLKFDPVLENLSYEENLAWLEEAKKIERNAEPLKNLFEYEAKPGSFSALQNFQVRSWALVSFFLISGLEEYYRTLTECFMLLSPDASTVENSMTLVKHIGSWDNFDLMEEHYRLYLNARRTFDELVEEGRNAYLAGNTDYAKMIFLDALDQKDDHYAPYYFLGLICYAEKDYELAGRLYRNSLDCGADEALVSYSLGLNAAAAGKNIEAISWLYRAGAADTVRFGRRTEELIRQLR